MEAFSDFMKQLYFPTTKDVQEFDAPKIQVISFTGKGSPDGPEFQQAVPALYGVAYTLKMGFKFGKIDKPKEYFNFKVPPLEGLWWQEAKFDVTDKDKWEWRVMIMLPSYIDHSAFATAVEQAIFKRPDVPYANVSLDEFDEGRIIQILHMGPYTDESETIAKLTDYAKQKGYEIVGKHHEIYMNDPRRVNPEKIKTVLRYGVKTN